MKQRLFSAKKSFSSCAPVLVPLALLLGTTVGQSPNKSSESRNSSEDVRLELVRLETGFFEAWERKDQEYLREHMPENGVFWGEDGTFSRDQQIAAQQVSAKACTVQGYSLSDFGALPLASGAYLLTYKADQYATCNGEKAPVHMNGSSIYVLKAGHWQAVYRAEVPLKNQG